MSLVFEAPPVAGNPQTHILIIGVAKYNHLQGGEGPLTPKLPPLGQLTSPPYSARALADWFTRQVNPNPDASLGSVELLISDPLDQNYTLPNNKTCKINSATMRNIEQSFSDWYQRCDTNPQNIAIFYFCGHGLETENLILLPEDFGSNALNPWATGINFNKTYRGMSECAASTQYFIVDACRQWTTGMLKDLDSSGTPTLKTFTIGAQKLRTAPKLFATASGLPAFGDNHDVSRLTRALLKCLEGGAATKKGGRWRISTSTLGDAVQMIIAEENEKLPHNDRQFVDPGGGEQAMGPQILHTFPADFIPDVSVYFTCLPDAATNEAQFYYKRGGDQVDSGTAGFWFQTLKAGVYDFGVEFVPGTYTSKENTEEFVVPPIFNVCLEVS